MWRRPCCCPRRARSTPAGEDNGKYGTAAAPRAAAVLPLSVFGGGIDMNFYERVYELVRRIPAGKCASYGQLALMLGNPRASRAVGYAMRACRTPGVPCPPGGACRRLHHPSIWPRRPAGDAGGRGGALHRRRPGGAGRLPVGRCLTGFACHLRTGVISFRHTRNLRRRNLHDRIPCAHPGGQGLGG